MIKKLLTVMFMAAVITISGQALIPGTTHAAVTSGCDKSSSFLGFPTWYKYLDIGPKDGDPCAIIGPNETIDGSNEFSFGAALPRIGLAIVEIMLRIAGLVGIGYTIFGGFQFMTSQGEAEMINKAKSTVTNALIGVAIAILATTIVVFIGKTLWT